MLITSHPYNEISVLREEGPGAAILWLILLSEQGGDA